MAKNPMRVVCRNCGEFFAFHGARPPHDCPITESHTEPSTFAPRTGEILSTGVASKETK